ncbi:MAG: hypothetical protein EOP05_08975 [Proteobacteria bacterium]|nr:MAG: hypothetical protein EOP05_08975 [Pseudomonadota bacterium]
MPRPAPNTALGSWDVSLRTPLLQEKDHWKSGYRLGFNTGLLNLSFESGVIGSEKAKRYSAVNLGFGLGPLMAAPSKLDLRWFARVDYFSLRWREERSTFYSAFELGVSRFVTPTLGAFISLRFDYPALFMLPIAALPTVRDDIRKHDGVALFLNIGLAGAKVVTPEQIGQLDPKQ